MSTDVFEMTSNRPYLLRAVHEWIVDNDLTPQIVVDAEQDQVQVPTAYVCEGKIVLNISATAVRGLHLGNQRVEFSTRFGGRSFDIFVPIRAVLAIMARENGVGISFPDTDDEQPPPEPRGQPSPSPGRPHLKVVK